MYFKVCFFSPIWLPLLFGALLLMLLPLFGEHAVGIQWLQGVCFLTGFALILGGIQYLIALVIVWRHIDFDCIVSIVSGCLFLPLVFTPIQLLPVGILTLSDGWEMLGTLLGFGLIDLMFGYGYVFLWFLGYWVFTGLRKLRGRIC